MKVKNEFFATAKDGNPQKFNAYVIRKTGKYVARFHVINYMGGKHKQWCGKGCTFKSQEEAIAFGYRIASSTEFAGDWLSVKKVVDLNSEYNKTFK
jgi:hypothetical protein